MPIAEMMAEKLPIILIRKMNADWLSVGLPFGGRDHEMEEFTSRCKEQSGLNREPRRAKTV